MWLICSAVLSVIFSAIDSVADEIGIATGLNVSLYKSWYEENSEYQKTDILNPIEITFQKDFTKFLGIHSALQYSKRSITETLQGAEFDEETGELKPAGRYTYEKTMNFLSLEISPIFFHQFNHILIDARSGVSGDFYINEWVNFSGEKSVLKNKEASSFVLSFVSGIGLGYIIKNRFKIGLRSSISRTLTDIYKNQPSDTDIFYFNFHSVICFGLLF